MSTYVLIQLEYLLRLFLAAICGGAIGYERKSRLKEAGIRTHFIVALGAALMMIVSKYGFQDQIGWNNLSLDPSRIAAQVVSGVGFLGAGIIFVHKETIKGLTTGAGIWATAGIGLAVGAGLYFVGIAATIIVIIGQLLLHGKIKWLSSPRTELVTLHVFKEPGAMERIQEFFKEKNVAVQSLRVKSNEESPGIMDLEILIKIPERFNTLDLVCSLQEESFVKYAEI
ncbi:MAG: MgtC/SapB family protein [Anaerovoracaceae bacterium]|jgi:putative Mg2+ transporter-C (MgtC) family protein